jgi:hypothetical protein
MTQAGIIADARAYSSHGCSDFQNFHVPRALSRLMQ